MSRVGLVATLFAAFVVAALACGDRAAPPRPAEAGPAPTAPATPGVDPRVTVAVDRRVELVSIVARLAGYPEYAVPARTDYYRAVDAHFAPWAAHPAVEAARALRARHGIGYNAPVGLAVYLDDDLRPRRPLTPPLPGLDERWDAVDLERFVAELQDFARVSDLDGFLAGQATFRAAVEERTRAALDGHRVVDWFERHFGPRPARFRVIPGLLTGDQAYAAFAVDDDGAEEIVQVLALPRPGRDGIPTPGKDTLYLLVHEFAHSWANPIVDAHQDELVAVAAPAHARFADAMARQNYTTARIMVAESLVRALVLLYARDRGPAGAGMRQLARELGNKFMWTGELADALAAVRAAHGGRLPPDTVAAAVRDTFTAWLAANPR